MNVAYQELISTVSAEVAKTFLETAHDLAERARLLDSDISEITRQIGRETTKTVLEHLRDDQIKKNKRPGSCSKSGR